MAKLAVAPWVILSALMAGCASVPDPVSPPPAPEPQVSQAERQAQTRQRMIDNLLRRAERALAEDRLLLPEYDNAYDRYAAVQSLDPDNEAARLGLQAIVLRYLDMAREAAQRSRFGAARRYLDRAAGIAPHDPQVQALVDSQREAIRTRPERPRADNAVRLDPGALSRRDETINKQLAELAHRAREQDSMIVIVAASDAQGRWIYQTMREAVTGYLLRGDIRVGAPPRIEFLPPP